MIRQRTRQRAGAARSSTPTAALMGLDIEQADAIATDYIAAHKRTLGYLASAQDSSKLESRHVATVESKQTLGSIMRNDTGMSYLFACTDIFQLHLRAAVNSMNVISHDIGSSLLEHCKLADIVAALCTSIALYISQATKLESQGLPELEGARGKVRSQILAAGLPAALSRFTETAWQALQQLRPSNPQTKQQGQPGHEPVAEEQRQQQQQQERHHHDLKLRCGEALQLNGDLLMLWQGILGLTPDCSSLRVEVEDILPLLIELTTAAAPVAKQIKEVAGSSSDSDLFTAYDKCVGFIAVKGLAVASFTAINMHGPEAKTQQQARFAEQTQRRLRQMQQGQHQHIYFTKRLPELMLQLLAHQAGQLHKACGGVSQAMQDRHAAAATAGTRRQQQQHQHLQFGGCVVASSHQILLKAVGLGYDTAAADGSQTSADIPTLVCFIAMALKTLSNAIRARYWRASYVRRHSSSSSIEQQAASQQQQQQQQEDVTQALTVLPNHLLVPAIRVLIELVLLLPSDNALSVHAYCLKMILLLLYTAVTPPAAAAAEAVGHAELQQLSPASASPLPELPAAVAAGLLQPVVAQLSQAVMCCLLQTDQQQQEEDMKDERLALLHYYGSLLVIVCQSVEPKHVAAVFKSQSAGWADLLVTLAAIEAVIRAQACHLAPKYLEQQQQQQQQQQQPPKQPQRQQPQQQQPQEHHVQCPSDVYNIACLEVLPSIAQLPRDQAPLLLLPFVQKVVGALERVVTESLKQQGTTLLATEGSVGYKLSARLFTLLNTALKVSKCAAEAATAAGAAQSAITAYMAVALGATTVSNCCFSAVTHTSGSAGNGGVFSRMQAMPVALLGRALRAWPCAWSCLRAGNDIEAESGPLAAEDGPQGLHSIVPLGLALAGLAGAFMNATPVLEGLAVQAAVHAASPVSAIYDTTGLLSGHSQSTDVQAEQLQRLLLQSLQVGAAVRSTLQAVVLDAGADIPAARLASMSFEVLCQTIMQRSEAVRPAAGLLDRIDRSVAMLCDLADAVVSASPYQSAATTQHAPTSPS